MIDRELNLFEYEYRQYYLEGESKGMEIGRPFLLHQHTAKHGILLIHGLMAAPEEVRELAEFLFTMGYTVYAVRMAGHGTSAADLATRQADDWIASVNRGHEILKACCEKISIAGFSTGASVALYQTISKPKDFDSLICISAPLKFKKLSTYLAEPVHRWNQASHCWDESFLGQFVKTAIFRKEFAVNHADNPHINYLRCPVNSIVEIKKLMSKVSDSIDYITLPTLVIHGTHDPKVDVTSSRQLFALIQANQKHYKEVDHHLHGIIRGDIALTVFSEVQCFLNQYCPLKR